MKPTKAELFGHECEVEGDRHVLTNRQYDATAALFSALGDPERLKVIHVLAQGRQCVGQLAGRLGGSMSSVSQRLKILRAADLVRREKVGKHVYYELADHHVTGLLQNGIDHATAPHDEQGAASIGK